MGTFLEGYLEDYGDNSNSLDYEAIRLALSPKYRYLPAEDIDRILASVMSRMSPEEQEGFVDTIKDFGNAIGKGLKKIAPIAQQLAPTVLPIVGGALGSFVGAPTIGATLGQMAGQAISGSQKPSAAAAMTPTPQQTPISPAGAPIPPGGTSSVNQILALIQNPAFLQSLLGQALGKAGQSTVQVGQQEAFVPFGAFMNALEQLASKAAEEANVYRPGGAEIPSYLLSEEGNLLCEDPAIPEQRAQLLLSRLRETYLENAEGPYYESSDNLTNWFVNAGLVQRQLF